jgi:hypothetical protein
VFVVGYWFLDRDGHESEMRWIPKFQACRALSSAAATPSGTIGDWFGPEGDPARVDRWDRLRARRHGRFLGGSVSLLGDRRNQVEPQHRLR